MADLATLADVESRWRPLRDPSQERTNATSWLSDASAALRVAITDVEERSVADADYARQVAAVVAMAVVRMLRGMDKNDPADYGTIFFSKWELASLETSGASELSNLPLGSFPDAQCWPDPPFAYAPSWCP